MTRPATILQPIAQPGDPAWTHRPDARSTLAAPVEILEATDKPARAWLSSGASPLTCS